MHDLDSMVQLVRDVGSAELAGGSAYGEYAPHAAEGRVSDDLLRLGIEAPEPWTEEIGNWLADDSDDIQGGYILATPDIDGLFDRWDTPGLFFAASPRNLDPAEVLDARGMNRRANCTGGADQVLSDGSLDGLFRVWTRCGDNGGMTIDLVAYDREKAGTMLLTFKAAGQRDLAAFHTAIDTLEFGITERDTRRAAPGSWSPDAHWPILQFRRCAISAADRPHGRIATETACV